IFHELLGKQEDLHCQQRTFSRRLREDSTMITLPLLPEICSKKLYQVLLTKSFPKNRLWEQKDMM
ncbi:MAG: hypothetical protein LIO74_06300, partial [Ruminococcus sp.]|nr:hypothetical protein [Ruminococcus sp.]